MPSFSSLPLEASSRTEVAETIAPDLVLRLIDQFLQEFGFLKASETLRKESRAFQETNSSSTYLQWASTPSIDSGPF
jgi:hypothetical protein